MSSLIKLGSLAKTQTEKSCVYQLSTLREKYPHDLWLRIKAYERVIKRNKGRVGKSMSHAFYKELLAFLTVIEDIYKTLGGKL